MKHNRCKIIGYHKLVENAFGILTAKCSILGRAIKANVDLVGKGLRLNYLQLADNREVEHDVYGKRQGGPRDQFFPPFVMFAVCSLSAVLNAKGGGFM